MKLILVIFLALATYVALTALGALIFSACLGELGTSFPRFSWWQSFCFLLCVALVGGSFGYAGAASKRPS